MTPPRPQPPLAPARPRRRPAIALTPLILAAAFLALTAAPAFALKVHTFSTTFGAAFNPSPTPANPYPLSNPTDVAVDNSSGPSAHDLYVTDPADHRVEKFTPSGEFILMFGAGVNETTGGDVCTAASGNTCKAGVSGSSPGAFQTPTFLAVDGSSGPSAGDVYVADASTDTVSKFDPAGDLISAWGTAGRLAFPGPTLDGIAVDPAGNLFVLQGEEEGEQTTYRYAQDGTLHPPTFSSATGTSPSGLAVDAEDGLYKSAFEGFRFVQKFSEANPAIADIHNLTGFAGSGGAAPPAAGLTIDPSSNPLYNPDSLYVDEQVARRESSGSVENEFVINQFLLNCGSECSPYETIGRGHLTKESAGLGGLSVDATSDALYAAADGDVAVFAAKDYPTPTTGAAAAVTYNTATVGGEVDPEGIELTECAFEYVTEAAYQADLADGNDGFSALASGGRQSCVESPAQIGAGETPVKVEAHLKGLLAGTSYRFRLAAKNNQGSEPSSPKAFTTPESLEGATTGSATKITNVGAELAGSYLAGKEGLPTFYYFEYTTAADHAITGEYGRKTSSGTLPGTATGLQHVGLPLTGLLPDTTYVFRFFAGNERGGEPAATPAPNEGTFTTQRPPTIEGVSSSHVTATSADLEAKLNPQVNPSEVKAECHFEYGPTTSYGALASCPEPLEGTSGQSVKVEIEGLSSGVTYHFRFVAANQWGTETSEDHSFEFFPPACPNSAVRQQTGSGYLPDCRAYELVSPGNANATLLAPGGPNTGQATNPSRFAYSGTFSSLPGENTIETTGDLYVATRTDTGWVSKYVGLPGNQTGCMGGPPTSPFSGAGFAGPQFLNDSVFTDPSMSRFVAFADGGSVECNGDLVFREGGWQLTSPSNAPYLFDSEGADLGRLPTDLPSLPVALEALSCPYRGSESFSGSCRGETTASPDLTHLFFSSNRLSFAEPGEPPSLTVAPGSAYDDDVATGKVTLISTLKKTGEPIPQPQPQNAGAGEFLRFPAVSTDGSHVLISTATASTPVCQADGYRGPGGLDEEPCQRYTETPIHLYMSIDDRPAVEVSLNENTGEDVAVNYVGMTPDGSRVYFTSAEELIPGEVTDTNTELYMWEAEKAAAGKPALTLISKPAGGADDTTECHPALTIVPPTFNKGLAASKQGPWTSGCDAVSYSGYGWSNQSWSHGGSPLSDSAIAQNGDIYFYSPAQLDGDRGVLGAQNLYDYRAGVDHYVTTLTPEYRCPAFFNGLGGGCVEALSEGPILRIDVSPDDSHMAFLTASRLTAYDNADPQGHCQRDSGGGPAGSANCAEMYSYTPATGALICDSCNPDGRPPTSDVQASQDGPFMTDDGRVFFSTAESLLPADTNGGEDVYEYVDGRPQLITPGTGTGAGSARGELQSATPGLIAVSANGTDAFFSTYDTLTSEDHNGNFLKFYDARTDGGFPQPSPAQPCAAAEECHGPGTEAPTLPTQGTAATLAGGNAGPGHHPKHHKKKHKSKKKHQKAKAKKTHKKKATAKYHKRSTKNDHGGKK